MKVSLDQQIDRVARRVEQLAAFLKVCPNDEPLTLAEKRRELEEYRAILATLIGHRAANEITERA